MNFGENKIKQKSYPVFAFCFQVFELSLANIEIFFLLFFTIKDRFKTHLKNSSEWRHAIKGSLVESPRDRLRTPGAGGIDSETDVDQRRADCVSC